MGLLVQHITGQFSKYDQFLREAFNTQADAEQVNALAFSIIEELQKENPATDKSRYQFGGGKDQRERALLLMFEISYLSNPSKVTEEAKKNDTTYPLLSRVCYIYLPGLSGRFIQNTWVKIALSITVFCVAYAWVGNMFIVTQDLIGRVLPFFINNTPIEVIRLGNSLLDAKDYLVKNVLRVLLYTWIARAVITRINIPYLTPLAQRIDLLALWNLLVPTPQRLGHFIFEKAFDFSSFTWSVCTDIGSFLKERSTEAEESYLVHLRAKAKESWRAHIRSHAPLGAI